MQVDGRSEYREVLANALEASNPCSAPSMAPEHHVAELAFDLRPGCSVLALPLGRTLLLALLLDRLLMSVD